MINEYAEIKDGVVLQVLVKDGTKEEAIQWLKDNISENEWIVAKIEDDKGRSVATRGGKYNIELKHFVNKKPYSNWVLDKKRMMYLPPLPKPLAIPIGYIMVWSQKAGVWVSKKIVNLRGGE